MGRWIHLKKTAHQHLAAMTEGLLNPKRCQESGAGPYCIAKPIGLGRVSEFLAWFLSILYGGYASTVAIESPGGDDDQQWLTFWIMLVASMVLEQTFARVLLSKIPFYYQAKLIFILWLMFFDGAAKVYRWLRIRMYQWSSSLTGMIDNHKQAVAQDKLNSIISIGGTLIIDRIALFERELKQNLKERNLEIESFGEYDYTDIKLEPNNTSLVAEEKLYQISRWLLSSEGMQKIENTLNSDTIGLLLGHAATVISFEPKILNIHLMSVKPGKGKLPVMDPNGKADCYIKFSLISAEELSSQKCVEKKDTHGNYINVSEVKKLSYLDQTVTSRIAYRTLEPVWNQILEVPIKGRLGKDGVYRNHEIKDTILRVEAWDADCGKWGIAFEIFGFLGCANICILVTAYIFGVIDFVFDQNISIEQWWWKITIVALTLLNAFGAFLSWMMSVVLKADDEFIGNSTVPLSILTDRREHPLALKLRDRKANHGILRLKLRLSEN